MQGLVLLRTEMTSGFFCTILAVQDKQGWRLIRPLRLNGCNLHYDEFALPAQQIRERWLPGSVVTFEPLPFDTGRQTHPEDFIIDDYSVQFVGLVGGEDFHDLINLFISASVREIFPDLQVQENGKAYIPANLPQASSLGYVRIQRMEFLDNEFVLIESADEKYKCKIKSDDVLRHLRNGSFQVGEVVQDRVVCLGLSSQMQWDNMVGPPRCYIMLIGLV